MHTYNTLVDPALAAEWLEHNHTNRPLSPRVVGAYARDMTNGQWRETGEAIKFATDGALLDGQHRLAAVVQSGQTLMLTVVEGLEHEAQRVLDSGRRRTVANNLSIAGSKYATVKAAAARHALTVPSAGFIENAIDAPTHAEINDFAEGFGEALDDAAPHGTEMGRTLGIPPSVIALAWIRFSQIDAEACREFFYSMHEQRTNGVGDPRLALVRTLANNRDRKIKTREYFSLIYRTWNAWRRGSTIQTIRFMANGREIPAPTTLV